jgi:hypothetical protein
MICNWSWAFISKQERIEQWWSQLWELRMEGAQKYCFGMRTQHSSIILKVTTTFGRMCDCWLQSNLSPPGFSFSQFRCVFQYGYRDVFDWSLDYHVWKFSFKWQQSHVSVEKTKTTNNFYLIVTQHLGQVCMWLLASWQKLRMNKILCKILPELGEFYFYLCPCWELMKSVGESWELVTAICDEDDCMRICEWHS